jgi:hypothetical protein
MSGPAPAAAAAADSSVAAVSVSGDGAPADFDLRVSPNSPAGPRPLSFPKSKIKVLLLERISQAAINIFTQEGYQVGKRSELQSCQSEAIIAACC